MLWSTGHSLQEADSAQLMWFGHPIPWPMLPAGRFTFVTVESDVHGGGCDTDGGVASLLLIRVVIAVEELEGAWRYIILCVVQERRGN